MTQPTSDYRTAALLMLDAHKAAVDKHHLAADELNRGGLRIIEAARTHGVPWDDIAHALGWDNGHAARMRYNRGQVI